MNLSFLIICNSQHQLEKGLYLKKMSSNHIDVACVKFQPDAFKIKKNFFSVQSAKELIPKNNLYERFIFFSIVPSKISFEYIRSLRESGKKVILIQETHQLSMSNGVVNSIMLSPDLILAASDQEKNLMIKNKLFKENTIISPGWIFQNEFHKFIGKELVKLKQYNVKDYILLVLSAPQIITSSSQETYQKRKEIIQWIRDNNPKAEILIKLHPLEDRHQFKKSFMQDANPLIHLAPNQSNLFDLGTSAKSIVISDKTQGFIDFVNIEKKIIVYSIGEKNFISSFLSQTIKAENFRNISFFSLDTPKESLKLFRSIFLKNEDESLSSILKNLCNPVLQINAHAINEIAMWEYIYYGPNKLSSNKLKLIEEILKTNDSFQNFDIKNLEAAIQTTSMQTSITLYLINKIINGKINAEDQIKYILQNFITPYFVQYFYLETQRLIFFLNQTRAETEMQKNSIKIFKNSLRAIQEKSILLKIIILVESKTNALTANFIRSTMYKFLNFLMVVIIRFKR
jgi:hypothetical protein